MLFSEDNNGSICLVFQAPYSGVYVLKKLPLLLLTFLLSSTAFADTGSIEFSIRFYNKEIYFTDSRIQILAEIYNNSPNTFRFKVSQERVFNLDFEVKTLTNERLEHSQEFIIDRNSDQPVLYREFSLDPGERYSVVENLDRFAIIERPGVYVIRGYYHPELSVGSSKIALASNYLTLSVQPGSVEIGPTIVIDRETGQLLRQTPIPPDEVISYMLRARQRYDWDKFFLYIDLEALYLQDRGREESYKRQMSDQERRAAISAYRESLMRETTVDEFMLIPYEFEVIKTSYTSNEATVLVIEKFAYSDYTEVKQYSYYLQRRDRIWLLYHYEVSNLRTE